MNTLFGLDLCAGTECNCIDRLSPELEPVTQEVRESLTNARANASQKGF